MPPTRFVALVVVLSLTVSVGSGAGQSPEPADSVILLRIDSLMAAAAPQPGPGCSVGVGRDGRPSLLRAGGMASLEYDVPLTPATVFHAASIAKQFTAAAVLLLAEDGKLSLNDDVRRYVPELPRYGNPISLRQLMHHTSGLRDQWDLLWLDGGRDDDAIEEEDVLAVVFRQRGLNFRPGEAFLYSNTGYTLLALVVHRVSGLSLKEFAAQRIFSPLGMSHTRFRDDRFEILPGVASGYRKARPGQGWGRSLYLRETYGPGGLFTTAEDLLRWYAALGGSAPALGPIRRQVLRQGMLSSGDSTGYSTGLELGRYRGHRYVRHGGNDLDANAHAIRFVDDRLSIAVLCNTPGIDSYAMVRGIADLFLSPPAAAAGADPRPRPPTIEVPANRLQKYAGVYYNPVTLATLELQLREGRLAWVRGGSETPLDAVAPDRFRFPPGQPAELFFPVAAPGGPQVMHLISGGTATVYHRAEPFVAQPGGLAAYAGEFTSPELDVRLKITVMENQLRVGTLSSWSFRVRPIFRDGFALPDVVVLRFTRDQRGQIDGVVADLSRSKGIRFRKARQ